MKLKNKSKNENVSAFSGAPGAFFAKFSIANGGFSWETKEPKIQNWVYLEQINVKKDIAG